jgi:hypothetical protein
MTIEIRRLGPADAARFDCVADGVFDHAFDRSNLAHYFATPGHHLLAAISGGEIVGSWRPSFIAIPISGRPSFISTNLR